MCSPALRFGRPRLIVGLALALAAPLAIAAALRADDEKTKFARRRWGSRCWSGS